MAIQEGKSKCKVIQFILKINYPALEKSIGTPIWESNI
jgi:hypothetical protein